MVGGMSRLTLALVCASCIFAQRPSNPALLVPQEAPALDYVAVADPLPVPATVMMGASSDVAFDSKGHLYVLSRGAQPLTDLEAGHVDGHHLPVGVAHRHQERVEDVLRGAGAGPVRRIPPRRQARRPPAGFAPQRRRS
mgnify:CR=1 FL=1